MKISQIKVKKAGERYPFVGNFYIPKRIKRNVPNLLFSQVGMIRKWPKMLSRQITWERTNGKMQKV